MRINKLSALGGIAGSVLMISSWIRYYIMMPDLDRAIIYVCVGSLIIAVSYLYDKIIQLNNTLYSVEEYIQDRWNKENEDGE